MKKTFKRIISLAMCAALLLGVMSISAFAISAEDYENVNYKCYTYIGDSISWGYGLDPSIDTKVASSVCLRVDGAFPDLVGKVLEQNSDAEVYSASSSGGRLCDFRMLLERGMGVEDPYTYPDDWFGTRSPVRTQTLRNMGNDICEWVSQSDLVTIELGINDITGTLVNSLSASGVIDLEKITSISGAEGVADYLKYALGSLREDPNVLAKVIVAFNNEIKSLRENANEVVKDVVELTPDDADILLVGYSNLVAGVRVLPDSEFSPLFDLVGAAFVSLNDYYVSIAAKYDNVYYVDCPDASVFFPVGTTVADLLKDPGGILLGLHPDAAGHEYIAQCVLDTLKEINGCRHTNTKVAWESVKCASGFKYIGSTVCCDCGKVLDMGKLETPVGTFDIPANTVNYTIKSIGNAVSITVGKIANGISSIFGKK